MKAARAAVMAAFALSGVATLVYEIVWVKWLVYLFGVTYHAITTIVTVFMLGLAVGALISGRLSDRVKDPLKLYAILEWVVAACGLLFPLVFNEVATVYHGVHSSLSLSFNDHLLLRFGLSCVVLLVPTVAMGATLPAIARFVVADRARLGVDLGRLYGLNTLGAALGCGLTGFYLIHTLGLTATNGLAVSLNILAGAVAMGLSYKLGPAKGQGAQVEGDGAPEGVTAPDSLQAPAEGRGGWGYLAVFFLAGFTVVAYELLWTRIIVLIHPNAHTMAFTVVLSVLLVLTAAGSGLYVGALAQKVAPAVTYGVLQLASGLTAAAAPFAYVALRERMGAQWYVPSADLARILDLHVTPPEAWIIFLAVGVPAFASGMCFPAGNRLYVRRLSVLGADVGAVYFASTVGGIVGSFVTGFFLMPAIGVKGAIFAMAAINITLGVGLVGSALVRRVSGGWAHRLAWLPALAAGALMVMLGGRLPMWMWINLPIDFEVTFYRDGRSTTDAGLLLKYGEKPTKDLYSTGELIGASFYAVWAPILLSDSPTRVMIQSFDSGGMSAMAVSHPRVESVVSVDISDVQPLIAQNFEDVNRGVMRHPKFKVISNDARNELLISRKPYNVIFHGVAFYASYLEMATLEYFKLARSRLAPGGIYAHKLHPAHISAEAYQRVIATFMDVFPTAWLWQTEFDDIQLLIGWRDETERFDYAALDAAWDSRQREAIHPGWDLRDFAARLELDTQGLKAVGAGAERVRDDVPLRVNEVLPALVFDQLSSEEETRPGEAHYVGAPMAGGKDAEFKHREEGESGKIRRMLDDNAPKLDAFFTNIPEGDRAIIDKKRDEARALWKD